MNWITLLLFESWLAPVILGGLLCFWLLVYWRRGGSVRPLLIALVMTLGWLLTQAVVTTQREVGNQIVDRIAADLLVDDIGALERALSEDFSADGMDRVEFLSFARRQMDRVRLYWAQALGSSITQSGEDAFRLRVTYLAEGSRDDFRGRFRSVWEFEFVRRGEWRVRSIVPVDVPGNASSRWDDFWR